MVELEPGIWVPVQTSYTNNTMFFIFFLNQIFLEPEPKIWRCWSRSQKIRCPEPEIWVLALQPCWEQSKSASLKNSVCGPHVSHQPVVGPQCHKQWALECCRGFENMWNNVFNLQVEEILCILLQLVQEKHLLLNTYYSNVCVKKVEKLFLSCHLFQWHGMLLRYFLECSASWMKSLCL